MDLPDGSTLNLLNKVLLALSDLAPVGEFCSRKTLINQCRSVAMGGQIADYNQVLGVCHEAGVLQLRGSRVRISSLGQRLLLANRDRFYEVTHSQKQLIAERIAFRGPWNHAARELFQRFQLNRRTSVYEFSTVDQELPIIFNPTIQLFRFLGILSYDGYKIIVNDQYCQAVYELTADAKAISELELERILVENRKLGTKGEKAVVKFEQRRLQALLRKPQAELVNRISPINVAAGYDVESFDGTNDSIFPNRFIEVKTTTNEQIRFYWSNNERAVAKKLKKRYWIYVLAGFRESDPGSCIPILINDPDSKLPAHASFSIESQKYLIEEIGEVRLKETTLGDVTWFTLK